MKLPDFRLFLPRRLPVLIPAVAVLLLVLAFVPVGLILRHRATYHKQPRIHLFQDMDNQPKLRAQSATPVFADGRAMRPRVAGTVSRNGLHSQELARGFTINSLPGEAQPPEPQDAAPAAEPADAAAGNTPAAAGGDPTQTGGDDAAAAPTAAGGALAVENITYVNGYPEGIVVDDAFLARGRQQYNAFCYVCHGVSGYGDGPVNQRGMELQATTNTNLKLGTAWNPSASFHKLETDGRLTYGPELYPNGQLYTTITYGKGNMTGYGHALQLEDRWSIVAYIRALQRTQRPQAFETRTADSATP